MDVPENATTSRPTLLNDTMYKSAYRLRTTDEGNALFEKTRSYAAIKGRCSVKFRVKVRGRGREWFSCQLKSKLKSKLDSSESTS